MDLIRELDYIDSELVNIERDIGYYSKLDIRETRRLEDIRNRLLLDRESILRELERGRDTYNRPAYGGSRPVNLQNKVYGSGSWSRNREYGSPTGITNNTGAFINSRGDGNQNHSIGVQSTTFSRKLRTMNQVDNQEDQTPSRIDLTDGKAEKIVSDALLSSLSMGKSKTLEIKFNIENSSTMEDIVSNNTGIELYITSLVNFLVINKLSINIEIDSIKTDKDDLINAINKTPNGEIYSNHVMGFINELYSKKIDKDTTDDSGILVFTEPSIILSNKDFDIIDEQLALTHVPSSSPRILSRKIYLGDYVSDRLKSLDELLRLSYGKRVILTTDEPLPRHLFLTKVTSNNKFIITNK